MSLYTLSLSLSLSLALSLVPLSCCTLQAGSPVSLCTGSVWTVLVCTPGPYLAVENHKARKDYR